MRLRLMLLKICKKIKKGIKGFFRKVRRFISKAKSYLERRKERKLIQHKRYKRIEVSVSDLFQLLSRNGEYLRYDAVVRYLAVEQYYGKNDYGYGLYMKMQDARIGDGYSEKAIDKFKKLIDSYDKNGYDKSSGIFLDRNLNLIDGSHRIALALYHHYSNITAFVVNVDHPVDYSVDWFFKNGFTTEEVRQIVEKSRELVAQVHKPFSCVIWGPAVKCADQIVEDIGFFGKVVSVKEYEFDRNVYENVVRAIYAIDDIESWKIEKKLSYMKECSPKIVSVDVMFDCSDFRLKQSTGLPLSRQGERLKKSLREKYKDQIDNYFFDIIMHVGDNVYQSDYMRYVMNNPVDFKAIVDALNKYECAFVKTDVPYMPKDFPLQIPVGKDADIICRKEDLESIVADVTGMLSPIKDFSLRQINETYGTRIRLEWGKALYYQIDLSYQTAGLAPEFTADALKKRIKTDKDYYILSPEYEYIFRMNAFNLNNKKIHHKEYLEKHVSDSNPELIAKYIG